MKLNYDKMIEAMAKAIWLAIKRHEMPNTDLNEEDFEHQWKWYIKGKKTNDVEALYSTLAAAHKSAKAALEALQGELPEVGTEHEPDHFYDKYNELKNLKED